MGMLMIRDFLKLTKEKFKGNLNLLSLVENAEKILIMLSTVPPMFSAIPDCLALHLFEEKLFIKLEEFTRISNIPTVFDWMSRRKGEVVVTSNYSLLSMLGFSLHSFTAMIKENPYVQ
jgi:hypothetical protein